MKGIFIKSLIKKFKDIKFRYKLVITYIFIGIIPICILGTVSYQQTKSMLMEHENSNMKDYVQQSVMSLDNQLQIYDNLSDYIAYNQTIAQVINYEYSTYNEMYDKFTNVLDPLLASLKYFHSSVNQVTIYTRNDFVKHDTTIAPLSTIEGQYWYEKIRSEKARNILWFVNTDEKKVFSARNMPSLDKGEYDGVLYINVDYEELFLPFTQMTSENYGVFVVDETNNVAFEYNDYKKNSGNNKISYEELEEEWSLLSNGQASNYTIVNAVTNNEWTVWLYRPNSVIMDSIWSIAFLTIAVTILCVIASLIAATGVSKLMVSSIEKLTDNMYQVEAGNMEITITSDNKDEVGELIRGFGMMIERINLLIEEVYEGKIAQKEYEMKALQAQINPHFLYNSLSLINWKAIEANQPDISRLTLLLSTFYRTALNRGNNILSVRDELNNMKSYLDIQLMMHEYEFDVEIDVEEEMMDYATLNLILQPLVENAIDHGIDLKPEGRGVITITGRIEDGILTFIVEDNGVGMDEEKAKLIPTQQSKGYGVRNVNERIKLLYGKEYNLEVHSQVGVGTKCIVRMPAMKMK